MNRTKSGTSDGNVRLRQNITPVIEDYLKAIYSLRQHGETVCTVALAENLGLKPPSVTAMHFPGIF